MVLNGVVTHTLFAANDNDHLAVDPDTGAANPNRCYVFGVTDADLAAAGLSFVAQAVPEPPALALWAAGAVVLSGAAAWRRRPV